MFDWLPQKLNGFKAALSAAVAVAATLGFAAGFVGRCHAPEAGTPDAFGPALLPAIRRLSAMVPGDLPQGLGSIVLTRFERSAASVAEGSRDEPAEAVRAAFQIRFPRGWIMVDAGLGPEFDPARATPTQTDYERLQQALLGASLIVVTHEHLDHVAGVVRSPYRDALAEKVLFTRTQLRALVDEPPGSYIRLDSEDATRFVAIEYDPLLPIAPGVVLIKAPGHTKGSQMVYVRLESGPEIIFAGDVANLWMAVKDGRQKPPRPDLHEDREALSRQMAWLRQVHEDGVNVLLAHDAAGLAAYIDVGLVSPELDMTTIRRDTAGTDPSR